MMNNTQEEGGGIRRGRALVLQVNTINSSKSALLLAVESERWQWQTMLRSFRAPVYIKKNAKYLQGSTWEEGGHNSQEVSEWRATPKPSGSEGSDCKNWGFYPYFIHGDTGVSSPHQIFTQGREALYNMDPRISETLCTVNQKLEHFVLWSEQEP